MKKSKKLVIAVCVIIVVAGIATGAVMLNSYIVQQRELEREWQEQRELASTYIRLNYAFKMGGDPEARGRTSSDKIYEWDGIYTPFIKVDPEKNQWGIDVWRYLILRFYENETGIYLAYETVIEYYSQEFEPDGSLRLYNNGKHPEIEALVTWMWEGRRREEVDEFILRIVNIHHSYAFERRNDAGFERLFFYQLSPQMLDALARADADPDYVLDLTSLQQAGY